jgi:hypothetical protein
VSSASMSSTAPLAQPSMGYTPYNPYSAGPAWISSPESIAANCQIANARLASSKPA